MCCHARQRAMWGGTSYGSCTRRRGGDVCERTLFCMFGGRFRFLYPRSSVVCPAPGLIIVGFSDPTTSDLHHGQFALASGIFSSAGRSISRDTSVGFSQLAALPLFSVEIDVVLCSFLRDSAF